MSRDQLSEASGLSYSLLTNMANDRRDPDPETLEALGKALPRDVMADLLIALWCDVCPDKLRPLVHLIPADKTMTLEEAPAKYDASPKADEELEEALGRVRRASIKHSQWRSAVITWSRTIMD